MSLHPLASLALIQEDNRQIKPLKPLRGSGWAGLSFGYFLTPRREFPELSRLMLLLAIIRFLRRLAGRSVLSQSEPAY